MGSCGYYNNKLENEMEFIPKNSILSEKPEEHNYIEQKKLEGVPISIPIAKMLPVIIDQSKKCICTIKCSDGENRPGFFCAIPFPDNYKKLPVLITSNKIFQNDDMNKILFLALNNDKLNLKIKVDNSRKIYIDEQYDIIIIEIKWFDGLDINSFLEVDSQIFNSNFNGCNISIYILFHTKDEKEEHSIGIIKNINEKYEFTHTIKTKMGSSGFPILNLHNNRLIGINIEKTVNGQLNSGKMIKESIKKFNEKYSNNFYENQIKNIDINLDKNIDEITIIYDFKDSHGDKRDYNEKIEEIVSKDKIFGEKFVEKNKKICKIIINKKEYELFSFLKNELIEESNKDYISIKLKGINGVNDLSYMFAGCQSLIYLPDIDKINTINITNMKCLFAGCNSLVYLPDIGKWKTDNLEDISYMFYQCSLSYIPDIGNWNTKKLSNVSNLFCWCRGLKYLPDISKWDTQNIINMSGMFMECYWVTTLPDISYMFFGCKYLTSLPDISKWDTGKVTTMLCMFCYCITLTTLPDISKWKTNNIRREGFGLIFWKCRDDLNIPINIKKGMYLEDE